MYTKRSNQKKPLDRRDYRVEKPEDLRVDFYSNNYLLFIEWQGSSKGRDSGIENRNSLLKL